MKKESRFPSRTASALLWFCWMAVAVYLAPGVIGSALGRSESGLPAIDELASLLFITADDANPPALPMLVTAPGTVVEAPAPRPAKRVDAGSSEPGKAPPITEPDHPVEAGEGALDGFFRSLAQTSARGEEASMTRVVHYGDSMLTGDTISGSVRRVLQQRFGNGGHGYVLAGRPWLWYRHQGVQAWNSSGFRVNRITKNPVPDGRFGLGAVVFRSFQGGARFFIEPTDGEVASRFEIFYYAHPNGGDLMMQVEGVDPVRIQTKAATPENRYYSFNVPEGPHRLTVTYAGGGEVRVFGVAVEREGPGVVWDSLGVNGLHASNFQRYNSEHIAKQMRHRDPSLIVVMLGTNESQNPHLNLDQHGEDYAEMLTLLRAGVPEASCLVMSPPDRALGSSRRGPSLISRIVARQREVALEEGCAFWSTFDAMGGEGSASCWRRQRPPLMGGDLTHPTPAGAEVIGQELAEALIYGYETWRASTGQVRSDSL